MTYISLFVVLFILFMHWLADFVFQSDEQATTKHESNYSLLMHTFVYSAMMAVVPICAMMDFKSIIIFFLVTFVAHTIQDYVTSRLNAQLWAEKKRHTFFVSVGFDQFLHITQLILTYYALTL